MTDPISMRAMGRVVGGRSEAIDDQWDGVDARIELNPSTSSVSTPSMAHPCST
ncbi:MAG: hypothetical protein WCI26_06145 [Acidimicrobiales bacterium]